MLYTRFKIVCKSLSVICRKNPRRCYTSEHNIRNILETMEFCKNDEKKFKNDDKEDFSNFLVKLEVVGSGAQGSPRSVRLHTDKTNYLFNCGEGLQRIAAEYKVKLARIPCVFVTYPSWKNISGLIGTALTVQSSGSPQLYIYGHSAIDNMFSATTKFVVLRKLGIKVQKCDHNDEFSDGVVRIKYVHLYPSTSSKLNQNFSDSALVGSDTAIDEVKTKDGAEKHHTDTDDDIDYYEYMEDNESKHKQRKIDKKRKKRSQSEACKKRKIIEEKYAISYICRTIKTAGALCVEKCLQLGIPWGPLMGQLKRGGEVVLPDGTVVKGSDVTAPDIPGAVIIFVECPSEDYLDGLLKEPAFYRHQSGVNASEDIASAVVHFTSSELIQHPKYQEWINRFSGQTKHLYINRSNKPLGSVSVFRHQCKINLLQPEIFPMLEGNGFSTFSSDIQQNNRHCLLSQDSDELKDLGHHSNSEKMFFKCENNPHINGLTSLEVYLRPKEPFDYSIPLLPTKEDILTEVFGLDGFVDELEKFKEDMAELEPHLRTGKEYPKILFLGTGSSQPNKTRNASAILIFISEKQYILMDCGEGTYGQIYHFFGKEKCNEILRNLSTIYISHMHADHHLGLITVLKEREMVFKETETECTPIYLLAPIQITRWLDLFHSVFENINHLYTIIPNAYMMDKVYAVDQMTDCCKSLGLKSIDVTTVDHCPSAYGVSIIHPDGWKLTYSGDTKPCNNLIKLGANSDILIHEATMEDTLINQAVIKAHSTTAQAIEVGKLMKAKFTLLTHFSQRYPHVPIFNDKFTKDVGFAFDNMIVPYNLLPVLPMLTNILKVIFAAGYEKMIERKFLYALRKKKLGPKN